MKNKNLFYNNLRKSLIKLGLIFPSNDEETEMFLKNTKSKELPDKYKTIDFLFRNKKND